VKPIVHCIYASLAVPSFRESDLPLLLEQARSHNATHDLTGMLLYIGGSFFQVLEGAADVVESLREKIRRDPRHSQFTLIINEPIAARDFSDWSMGFSMVDRLAAGELIGENDFFNSASCVSRLDQGRAKLLFLAFRGGRWRLERTGQNRVLE
jgi:Sensors of blue-light using FAD